MKQYEFKVRERKSGLWKLLNFFYADIDLENNGWLTFGNYIFCPKGKGLPKELAVHEYVHVEQQKGSKLYAMVWWIPYTLSRKFRYSQELPAYRRQLSYLAGGQDKTTRHAVGHKIATILSGSGYNNMVSYEQAIKDLGL